MITGKTVIGLKRTVVIGQESICDGIQTSFVGLHKQVTGSHLGNWPGTALCYLPNK